MKFYWISS